MNKVIVDYPMIKKVQSLMDDIEKEYIVHSSLIQNNNKYVLSLKDKENTLATFISEDIVKIYDSLLNYINLLK